MSYYNYHGYPYTTYGGSRSYIQRSPGVNPLSGLTLGRKQQRQKDKQKNLLASVIILAILLVGAIIAIIVFYVKPTTPPPEPTAGVDYINVTLTATRSDITYDSQYADENQNAYQSVAKMTCYQISQSAVIKNYIVVNCEVNGMEASQLTGLDIITKIRVLIMNQSPNEAFLGLGTALSEVEDPLEIDLNRMQLD